MIRRTIPRLGALAAFAFSAAALAATVGPTTLSTGSWTDLGTSPAIVYNQSSAPIYIGAAASCSSVAASQQYAAYAAPQVSPLPGEHICAQAVSGSSTVVVMPLGPNAVQDGYQPNGTTGYTASSATTLFSIDTTGYNSIVTHITANASANTVMFEGSNDNSTWNSLYGTAANSASNGNVLYNSGSSNFIVVHALTTRYFRARISTYNGGSTTVVPALRTAPAAPNPNLVVTTTGLATQYASTGGGETVSFLSSAASTNATTVKSGSGFVATLSGQNTAAYDVYVKLYNKASPTVGADTPIAVLKFPAGATQIYDFNNGMKMSTAVAFAITRNAVVSDTTAVAAGDLLLTYRWL